MTKVFVQCLISTFKDQNKFVKTPIFRQIVNHTISDFAFCLCSLLFPTFLPSLTLF